jgi:hypothetical protein
VGLRSSDLIECALRLGVPVGEEALEWMRQMHPERLETLLAEFPAVIKRESLLAPLSAQPGTSGDRRNGAVSAPLRR